MNQDKVLAAKFVPQQYEVVTIRLSQALLDELDGLSVEFGLSRNEFISQCLRYVLAQLEPPASIA